jgi:5-methylcytosine-specific restriction enzyme subunit McrC
MPIPIENIYYLLCYAWNKLDEKETIKVSTDGMTELADLFAKILINATKRLLKRGIDHDYLAMTNEIQGIKGKLLLSDTLKKNLFAKQKTICIHDEFTSDILSNQILLTSIYRLMKIRNLDNSLKKELSKLIKMFPDIHPIKLSNAVFAQVRLNRNNRFYGFILNVCRIIYEYTLPSENEGEFIFTDFIRDEKKMPYLFESFIRNFYRIEQNKFRVGREDIQWKFESKTNDVPKMQTDITLDSINEKIIIDAKFYSKTLVENYDKKKIHSTHLYQLFSYLLNQRDDSILKTTTTKGILLYPTVDEDYDLCYKYDSHDIQICTVNLQTDWQKISNRLKEIIKCS